MLWLGNSYMAFGSRAPGQPMEAECLNIPFPPMYQDKVKD
jgi:hypothetical protein